MRPTFNHRVKYQRLVSYRFKRDLVLIIVFNVFAICALLALTIFGRNVFDDVDEMQPTAVFIVLVAISCLMFFLKYARK